IGIGAAGTPSEQRHVEADNRRVQDLRAIAWAIHSWRQRNGLNQPSLNQLGNPLPTSLSELVGKGINALQALDPETRKPYEYRVRAGRVYELCAAFSGPAETDQVPGTRFWNHGKGRTCFTLNASQAPAW